ncbi:MAG: phosphotransferase family protein, partial [Myxococcota bacterium]
MSERLRAFVADREGLSAEAVEVRGLRRLAGGASRLLWSVDVRLNGDGVEPETLELVLRQDPPGRIAPGGMELEFELLRAAAASGVPVPRVYWCSTDSSPLGSPFFAMERIAGEAIPRRLLRDERYAQARDVMTSQLGAILAGIHRVDIDASGLRDRLPHPSNGTAPALAEIDRVVEGYRAFALEPHPVLDLAERWLRARLPPTGRIGLVHGDYRIGNVIFDESGTRAILDWELAHVGDPVEDLGWLCVRAWRFGRDSLAAGGIGTREELVRAYEAAGGAPVDPAALRFWEMCGNFKLALVFITQARAYLDGAHPTVELAALG